MTSDTAPAAPGPPLVLLAARSVVGGVLMGLANLVPGISGGTMLLAAGIYPRFIRAIAEVTTLRLRLPSLVVLGSVAAAAVVAIGLLAGVVKDLVVAHRWIMYSLFIGLTLGGIPVIWKMVPRRSGSFWGGVAGGFVAMALLAWAQMQGLGTGGAEGGSFFMLCLAGVAGAGAMILPGVSGGYLLLVLGQYVAILGGIDTLTDGLRAGDMAAVTDATLGVVLPVGIGVLVGIVGVSNLLERLLARFELPTLGALLGLLLGAVAGLWPFQAGVEPQVGDLHKGTVLTAEALAALSPEDWPTAFFTPTAGQGVAAIVLVGVGFGITALVARLGRDRDGEQPAASSVPSS